MHPPTKELLPLKEVVDESEDVEEDGGNSDNGIDEREDADNGIDESDTADDSLAGDDDGELLDQAAVKKLLNRFLNYCTMI